MTEEPFELPDAIVITLESENGALQLGAVGLDAADNKSAMTGIFSCRGILCSENGYENFPSCQRFLSMLIGLGWIENRTVSTMIVDFTQLPPELVCIILVVNVPYEQKVTNASISVNALTSGDLSNSFVCTEPLAKYVSIDTGGLRAYIMAKYDYFFSEPLTLVRQESIQVDWLTG